MTTSRTNNDTPAAGSAIRAAPTPRQALNPETDKPNACPHIPTIKRWKAACTLISVAFALLLLLEIAPIARKLTAHTWPSKHPWRELNSDSFQIIRRATITQLEDPPQILRSSANDASRLEMGIRSILRPNDANFWPTACIALGIQAAITSNADETGLQEVRTYCDSLVDEAGIFRRQINTADQCMIGYTMLDLYEKGYGSRYRFAADNLAKFLLHKHIRSKSQCIPYRGGAPDAMLVDTLGMICPFLARYGHTQSSPEAVDLAVRQLAEFLQYGIDVKTGLPHHAYRAGDGVGYGPPGWSRGVGWLAIGLAETLRHLPREHKDYAQLSQALSALARAVEPYQKDGLWPWSMLIPNGTTDTSGTAMIAYAMEVGMDLGCIDPRYSHISEQALNGILRHTDQNGVVGQALAECQGVGHYPNLFGPAPWAQGPTLALAATLQHRMNREVNSTRRNDPAARHGKQ